MKVNAKGKNYWQAGLVAGVVAAILNTIIYLIMVGISGYDWAMVIVGSILLASLMPNLIAALAYYGLGHLTDKARLILTILIVLFVLISVLPHLGIGPAPSSALAILPEGFDLLTIPLHIVFGATAIFIIPWQVARH